MSARKRGTNFSNTEKLLLIEIITQYKDIIENKKTDAVFTKEKGKCWDEISKQFNSGSSIFRDVLTLKNCWDNLKKRTRKYYAEERSKLYKTGGGPCEIQHSDPIMEKTYCIIKPSVDGLNNEFDNDNIENNVYFHHETNSDSDGNNKVVPMEELFEETQVLSDDEDDIIKHINTIQDTSDSYPIAKNIDRNKCLNMGRNVFNKERPIKQTISRGIDHQSQFQNKHDFNKNVFKENNGARPECSIIRTNEQLQDITNYSTFSEENEIIDRDSSTTIQKEISNASQKMGKNTSLVNVLKKKMGQSHKTHKESVLIENDHARTFHKKRIDSISQKVLKTSTLTDSKKELVDLMKTESEQKHDIKIQILNMQLRREKLHVQLIEKEIAIKDCLLKRLQNTENLEDIEYLNE